MQTCMTALTLEGSVYFKYSVLLAFNPAFNLSKYQRRTPAFYVLYYSKLSEVIHAQEQLTGLSETSYLIESHV